MKIDYFHLWVFCKVTSWIYAAQPLKEVTRSLIFTKIEINDIFFFDIQQQLGTWHSYLECKMEGSRFFLLA